MKKRFSLKDSGLFWVEEEDRVYSVYDMREKKRRYYDSNGTPLEHYERKPAEVVRDRREEFCAEDEEDGLVYNRYGVACADDCLVDTQGEPLPDTALDFEVDCDEANRYFVFGRMSEEQSASVSRCGTAEGLRVDYYDTKTRRYVLRGIPEGRLDITGFDGEPEVLTAAAGLLEPYDEIRVRKTGTIVCYKDGEITVWTYER